ncbi:MAG: hypothetical protein WD042_17475 [Phycisphaeraceae bacterium]
MTRIFGSSSCRGAIAAVAALAAVLLSPAVTQAIPWDAVTFDLTSPTPIETYLGGPVLTDSASGVSLTAMAIPRAVHQDADGMGVTGGIFIVDPTDNSQIDGSPAEALTLLFNQRVRVEAIVFSRVGFDDTAAVSVDGSMSYFGMLPGGNASDTGTFMLDVSGVGYADRWTGTQITFAALMQTSDFKIQSLIITRAPNNPTPSAFGAGLLLLAGLAGTRILRRAQPA